MRGDLATGEAAWNSTDSFFRWKSLRTTNPLENLNREFRRRTKTQASFGTEAAAITLLYGLVAFGQIVLRRIDGHEQLSTFLAKE
jgi:putative transposase